MESNTVALEYHNRIGEIIFYLASHAEYLQNTGAIQVDDQHELCCCILELAKAFEELYSPVDGIDYSLDIETFAHCSLREIFPPTEKTKCALRRLSFIAPNGLRIVVKQQGELSETDHSWEGLDISVHFPSGHKEALCSVDYESVSKGVLEHNRLRVLTYRSGGVDPDAIIMPISHRSIWISRDEGTYYVNVWDEDVNERDGSLEIGNIASPEDAECQMNEIISGHDFIWTIREMQIK